MNVFGMRTAVEGYLATLRRSLRPQRTILRLPRTLFGRVRVVDTTQAGRPVRILEVDGSWQSATYLDEGWADLAFPYHQLYDVALGHLCPRRVLMLGGGGYAYPKHLLMLLPDVQVDVVEADPAIVEVAHRYFLLDRLDEACGGRDAQGRLRTLVADAHDVLELGAPDNPAARWDLILNDVFAAEKPLRTLATPDAAVLIHRLLDPSGAYLANVIGALEGAHARTLHEVMHNLETAFAHVWVIPCSPDSPTCEDNNVIVATDAAWVPEGACRR